jgi:hypothetical protein
MRYRGPLNSAGGVNGNDGYVDGNPATGVQGSIPSFLGFEQMMRAMHNVVADAGLTPAATPLDDHQVGEAIQTGKLNFAAVGGTANAITGTLTPAPTALRDGMRVWLMPIFDITGPSTFNLNALGAKNIVGNSIAEPATRPRRHAQWRVRVPGISPRHRRVAPAHRRARRGGA